MRTAAVAALGVIDAGGPESSRVGTAEVVGVVRLCRARVVVVLTADFDGEPPRATTATTATIATTTTAAIPPTRTGLRFRPADLPEGLAAIMVGPVANAGSSCWVGRSPARDRHHFRTEGLRGRGGNARWWGLRRRRHAGVRRGGRSQVHQLGDERGRQLFRRHEEAERPVGKGDLELCRRPAVREGKREPGANCRTALQGRVLAWAPSLPPTVMPLSPTDRSRSCAQVFDPSAPATNAPSDTPLKCASTTCCPSARRHGDARDWSRGVHATYHLPFISMHGMAGRLLHARLSLHACTTTLAVVPETL